jgi:hypothetical protein
MSTSAPRGTDPRRFLPDPGWQSAAHEEISNMTTCEHKGTAAGAARAAVGVFRAIGGGGDSWARADVPRSTSRWLPFERTDALKPGLGWWYDNR